MKVMNKYTLLLFITLGKINALNFNNKWIQLYEVKESANIGDLLKKFTDLKKNRNEIEKCCNCKEAIHYKNINFINAKDLVPTMKEKLGLDNIVFLGIATDSNFYGLDDDVIKNIDNIRNHFNKKSDADIKKIFKKDDSSEEWPIAIYYIDEYLLEKTFNVTYNFTVNFFEYTSKEITEKDLVDDIAEKAEEEEEEEAYRVFGKIGTYIKKTMKDLSLQNKNINLNNEMGKLLNDNIYVLGFSGDHIWDAISKADNRIDCFNEYSSEDFLDVIRGCKSINVYFVYTKNIKTDEADGSVSKESKYK